MKIEREIRNCFSEMRFLFTLLVVYAHHHGEGGAQWDDAGDGAGPGTLALLDLHPTVDVVTYGKKNRHL